MKGRSGAAFGLLLCASAVQAQFVPEVMVLIGSNSAGAELHVNRASLRPAAPSDAPRGVTTLQLAVEIRSPGGRRSGAVTERITYSFNCRARTIHTLSYFKAAANRTRTHDWRAADLMRKYDPVRPGSLAEMALSYACSGGKLPLPQADGLDPNPELDDGL